MVGNDVVDLRDPDTAPGSTSLRFDARVFCEEELDSLASSPSRVRRRWRLWAAKEAAYKLCVKRDPTTVFAPSRFRVRLAEGAREASVQTPCGVVRVRLREEDDHLHAVATTAPAGEIVSGAGRIAAARPGLSQGDDPSAAVRRFALDRLARRLAVRPGTLEIRKCGRVPVLWQAGAPAAGDLSLSHHGGAVAFAYERSAQAPVESCVAGSRAAVSGGSG